MEKIRYRYVYDRKHALNRSGEALVQLEARQYGRKAYFSTGVYLRPSCWDPGRSMVVAHPDADGLNAFLYDFMLRVQGVELGLWMQGVEVTLPILGGKVRGGKAVSCLSFAAFAEEAVHSGSRRESTRDNMMSTVRLLRRFRPSATFRDIRKPFAEDFARFLSGLGERESTVGKHLRHLRTLVGEAVAAGYVRAEENPFRGFRIREGKSSRRELSPGMLRRVVRKEGLPVRQSHVRDAFVFCCLTGLRFSDFSRLRGGLFRVSRGKTWLCFHALKTGVAVKLPLSALFGGKALEILGRYPSVEVFADVGCNAAVNKLLKEVFSACGIRDIRGLSFHSSRHTFASLLVNAKVPLTTVQRLLGHTSVRTTQGYSHVGDSALVRDVSGVKVDFG